MNSMKASRCRGRPPQHRLLQFPRLRRWIGSRLLGHVSGSALQVFIGFILLISALKMMMKQRGQIKP